MDIPNFDDLDGIPYTALEPVDSAPVQPSSDLPIVPEPLPVEELPPPPVRPPDPPSQLLFRFEELYGTVSGCLNMLLEVEGSGVLGGIPLPTCADYVTDLRFDEEGVPVDLTFSRLTVMRANDPFHWEETLSSRDAVIDITISPPQPLSAPIDSILSEFAVTPPPTPLSAIPTILNETGAVPQAFKDRYLSAYTQSELNVAQLPSVKEITESRSQNQYMNAIEDKLDVSEFAKLLPEPAIVYPFELDTFQKRAVYRVEQGQNVFVAAHTSAGKTVVAEYAIALAKHHLSRVIYTSPIKALSNQKYRDFKELFGEVGIMTGDVVVDPESFCLVMTTEVLRSMLYRGSSKIKDLEWVILDEVHYINDDERGVIWEEVLIMLPPHVKLVMLSATVPNYLEFSDWVGRARNQKVYVQMTNHRPIPLLHQVYCNGQLWDLIETDGTKKFDKYESMLANMLKDTTRPQGKDRNQKFNKPKGKRGKGGPKVVSEDQRYKDLVRTLNRENLLPCILFSFSRDKCDTRAKKLGDMDLLTKQELSRVKIFVSKAMKKLAVADRGLPQVREIISLLEKGIGIHHSGLLPILKEMVEILFAEGLIKVMAATETVAIGLNMPTRTVVFCEMRKFDGNEHRNLRPGEYTQMSGRAGRRGKDECGHVIIFLKDPNSALSRGELEMITVHQALDLTSKFKLGYNTIANVLITETLHLEDIAKKSFTQNDTINASVANQLQLKQLQSSRDSLLAQMGMDDEPLLLPAVQKVAMLAKMNEALDGGQLKKSDPKTVLRVMNDMCFNIFAVVTGYERSTGAVEVQLLDFTMQMKLEKGLPGGTSFQTRKISLSNIFSVHGQLPKNTQLLKETSKVQDIKLLQEQIQIALKKQIPSANSFKLPAGVHESLLAQREELIVDVQNSPLFTHPQRHMIWQNFRSLNNITRMIDTLTSEMGATDLAVGTQIQAKMSVMKRFDLLNSDNLVQIKGRAIAETNNPFNIIIVELMFVGAFGIMQAEDIPALCSLFVNDAKGELDDKAKEKLPESLLTALQMTEDIYGRFLDAERECNVADEGVELVLRYSLVNPVYQWAKGVSFLEITNLTKIREGNIVRTILRIHEMMQRLRNVAVLMGSKDLKNKLEDAIKLITRDIAFATSLYITG